MATSDQIRTLLKLTHIQNNGFYKMPKPLLLQLIGGYYHSIPGELETLANLPIFTKDFFMGDDSPSVITAIKENEIKVQEILKPILEKNPASNISILLHYIAFGNPQKVKEMLEKNPELLLKAGDVMLPSGDIVLCVAPYECLLGCGDHYKDMHDIFNEAFTKIKDGGVEKNRQYERFKPCIEEIYQDAKFKQKAYDFQWIIDIIKQSSIKDVCEELKTGKKRDLTYQGKKHTFFLNGKLFANL